MSEILGGIEMCRLAIIVYWRVFYGAVGLAMNEDRFARYADRDASYLLEDDNDGVRCGAPHCPDVKLRLDRSRGFYLDQNGMGREAFLRFQKQMADAFAENSLPFDLTSV